MSAIVDMKTDAVGDLRSKRLTLSRVPVVGELVRVLTTVNGLTTAFTFKVITVVHAANTDHYSKRPDECDAWIDAVSAPGRFG